MKPFSASDYLATIPLTHKLRDDGMIEATGTIHVTNKNLTELPDLSNVILNGSFFCDGNQLGSLKGIPHEITGHVDCKQNSIIDLSYLPRRAATMTFDRASYERLKWEVQKHGLGLEDMTIIGSAVQVDGKVLEKLHDAKQNEQQRQQEQSARDLEQNIYDTCHNGTRVKTQLVKKIVLKP